MTGFFGKKFVGTTAALALVAAMGVGVMSVGSNSVSQPAHAAEAAQAERQIYAVFFEQGEAVGDFMAEEIVAMAADAAIGAASVKVRGFIDHTGEEAYLNGLAYERAGVVVEMLAELGVAADIAGNALPEAVSAQEVDGGADLQRAEITITFGTTTTASVAQ